MSETIDKLQRKISKLERFKIESEELAKRLKTSEKGKTAILNALFEYVALSNSNYKFLWVNNAFAQLFGMKPEQLREMHCYTLFNGLNKPCRNCTVLMKDLKPTNISECAFLGRIWKVCLYPLASGDKILSTYTDITNIKTAEKVLLEGQEQKDIILSDLTKSEENYRIMFKEARDPILIITKEGKFVDVNQACFNMLGTNREEKDCVNFWDYVLARKTKGKFIQDMEKHKFLVDFPVRIQRSDDTQIDCLLTSSVQYGRDGNIVGYRGIIRDITERKKLQKEVLKISERQRREIGQALHDDLGQVLTGIALKSKSISQSLEKKGCSEAKDVDRLKELANEALSQTRQLIKGLVPGNLQTNDISAALEELSFTISNSYGIPCRFHSDLSEINFDSVIVDQLYHIAQEAAINAVKHSKASRISLKLDKIEGGAVLLIEDDDIGFSMGEKPHDGRGTHIMEYRASMIDSTFSIKKNKGKGTSVICMVPSEMSKRG